jgi:deoxycytidine triphosphate deaminase
MLGGKSILKQVELGNIKIDPAPKKAGPHSIDLHLGDAVARVIPNDTLWGTPCINTRKKGIVENQCKLDNGAFVFMPHQFYLGHTIEVIGSKFFAPMLHGRSTAARHGLTCHLSAGYGDCGWTGTWVLEIYNYTPYPMMVWPGDRICQVDFTRVEGEYDLYDSTYQGQSGIVPAKGLAE